MIEDGGLQADPLMFAISDQDWMVYKDRWVILDEENALSGVINTAAKGNYSNLSSQMIRFSRTKI